MRNAQIDAWARGWLEKSRQYWEMVKPIKDAEQSAETMALLTKRPLRIMSARLRAGITLTRQQTTAYLAASECVKYCETPLVRIYRAILGSPAAAC